MANQGLSLVEPTISSLFSSIFKSINYLFHTVSRQSSIAMSRIKQDSQIFLISSSFLFLVFPGLCDAQLLRIFKFDAMYQLGDSLADTGNRIILGSLPGAGADLCSKYPYGETFFNRPTGRCSNGLLIIDYLGIQ